MKLYPQAIKWGAGATACLLLLFALIVRLLSGSWQEVLLQFSDTGWYIVVLAGGFGVQVAIWKYLRLSHKQRMNTHGVTAVSGTTSTIGMLACCTHYLVNIVPFIGLAGAVGVLTAYRAQILTARIGLNFLGIAHLVQGLL